MPHTLLAASCHFLSPRFLINSSFCSQPSQWWLWDWGLQFGSVHWRLNSSPLGHHHSASSRCTNLRYHQCSAAELSLLWPSWRTYLVLSFSLHLLNPLGYAQIICAYGEVSTQTLSFSPWFPGLEHCFIFTSWAKVQGLSVHFIDKWAAWFSHSPRGAGLSAAQMKLAPSLRSFPSRQEEGRGFLSFHRHRRDDLEWETAKPTVFFHQLYLVMAW